MWYQFKSLYKCPRIQSWFFFCLKKCIFFGITTGGLTWFYFLQVFIYLTLFFKIFMYGFSHQFGQKLHGVDQTHGDSDTPHKADRGRRRNVWGDVDQFSWWKSGLNINWRPVKGYKEPKLRPVWAVRTPANQKATSLPNVPFPRTPDTLPQPRSLNAEFLSTK